jgi:hypothetical protein
MTKQAKTMIALAAITGLISGTSVTQVNAGVLANGHTQVEGKAASCTAKDHGKEHEKDAAGKHEEKAKGSCAGKDGCTGKEKGSCSGKKEEKKH